MELRRGKIVLKAEGLRIVESEQAIWALLDCGNGVVAAVRLLEKDPHVSTVRIVGKLPRFTLSTACLVGDYEIAVLFEAEPYPSLRATVRLTTKDTVKLTANTREVMLTDSRNKPLREGLVFTAQTGPTSGHAFVAAKDSTVFYIQNLGALAPYSAMTGTSLEATVGVEWPEIGFKLPTGPQPIAKGSSLLISDLFVRVTSGSESEAKRALDFIDGLAWAYRATAPLPGPWYDWPAMAARTVRAIGKSKSCVRKIKGVSYLNAYVGSDYKPPESMVQAAVRVALTYYEGWLLKADSLARSLGGNLDPFFLKDLGALARWLPGEKFLREPRGEEEEAERMDSWYLLHTMMNLGELAGMGKEAERKLFLACLDYVVKAARHFDYDWPVFYNRKTFEVLKRETEKGEGGEQDAAGLYAHVMLQAWKLTADRMYLEEAETAAMKLRHLGFGVLYQTNNTVFTAVAMGRLWRETGNGLYKDLSLVCMGSVLSHLWMWEPARPGHTWKTYMGLPPLHDAPYIAPYEEAEVFASFRTYLEEMAGEVPESLLELLVEYGRHLLGRARYYLPRELPPDALCREPREGVIDPSLPVPLEDLYPSTSSPGQVGQEVYGAALSLVLATRSSYRWKDVPFLVWCEAPLAGADFEVTPRSRSGSLRFRVVGPPAHRYAIRLIPVSHGRGKLRLRISRREADQDPVRVQSKATAQKQRPFDAAGGATIEIEWSKS